MISLRRNNISTKCQQKQLIRNNSRQPDKRADCSSSTLHKTSPTPCYNVNKNVFSTCQNKQSRVIKVKVSTASRYESCITPVLQSQHSSRKTYSRCSQLVAGRSPASSELSATKFSSKCLSCSYLCWLNYICSTCLDYNILTDKLSKYIRNSSKMNTQTQRSPVMSRVVANTPKNTSCKLTHRRLVLGSFEQASTHKSEIKLTKTKSVDTRVATIPSSSWSLSKLAKLKLGIKRAAMFKKIAIIKDKLILY